MHWRKPGAANAMHGRLGGATLTRWGSLTFVELLVGYFQQMGLQHSKKVGQDNFGRAERAMHIDNDLERTIGVLCKSPEYLHYAPHIRKGCTDILGDARAPQALRTFQSVTLTPAETVARKSEICVDLYKVCRPATPERRRLSECERCAESMMDLHFVLRRSGRDSSMPFVKGSRLSRKHIITELQELCYDTEHRHPKGEVDGIRESCERLTEEFEEEIVKSFVAREDTGQTLVNPVKSVCVGVTEVCDKAEFEDGFSRLANTPFYKRSGSATENADPAPNFRPPTPMPPSEPSDEL
eukprot:TRINITY_DN8232_c0_g1_i4.p1 TRINITY_DN8232_c0_g1~~TRINITY_DN8232_c0_g1_i4.p1  ORF type:complete len:297 (+),score=40.16 TRINITY_DN8232_c0_g1_i4:236-1126(+)